MTHLPAPRPGDFGFATIPGGLGGWVNLGQAVLHDSCRFTHVFVVVYPVGHPGFRDGLIQEAMPGGMCVRPLADRIAPGYAYAPMDLTEGQRDRVPEVARTFMPDLGDDARGPGYSFGTYLALGLAQYRATRWSTPGLKRLIDKHGRLICSQHADEFARRLGLHLFTDGRWRGDVTPGDCFYRTDRRVIL